MLIIYGYLLNDAKCIPCNECCYHYNLLGHSQSKDCIKVKHKSKGLFKAITIVKQGNILLRIQLYWNKSLGCFLKTEMWDHRPSLLLTGIVHTKVSQTFMTRGNFTAWSKTLAVRLQPSHRSWERAAPSSLWFYFKEMLPGPWEGHFWVTKLARRFEKGLHLKRQRKNSKCF